MALRFGTSGLRGLVTEMTPEAVAQYTHAFLSVCDSGAVLCVGQDLRPSSPRIADNVIAAARQTGMRVINCGPVPTPALALAAQAHGGGAVMVTGSHIPADRNGLKFYRKVKGFEETAEGDSARIIGKRDDFDFEWIRKGIESAVSLTRFRALEKAVVKVGCVAIKPTATDFNQ